MTTSQPSLRARSRTARASPFPSAIADTPPESRIRRRPALSGATPSAGSWCATPRGSGQTGVRSRPRDQRAGQTGAAEQEPHRGSARSRVLQHEPSPQLHAPASGWRRLVSCSCRYHIPSSIVVNRARAARYREHPNACAGRCRRHGRWEKTLWAQGSRGAACRTRAHARLGQSAQVPRASDSISVTARSNSSTRSTACAGFARCALTRAR